MEFKEEWLFPNAVVPVDATTTRLLVEQLKTMLVTIGQLVVEQQPAAWVGLTDEEVQTLWKEVIGWGDPSHDDEDLVRAIEAKLKEKNT